MGHMLTALIASPVLLSKLTQQYGLRLPVELPQGFAMLPLSPNTLDFLLNSPERGDSKLLEGFEFLDSQMVALFKKLSSDEFVAYVETEYFGGTGGQGAIVFKGGEQIYVGHDSDFEDGKLIPQSELNARSLDDRAINGALKLLGVKKSVADLDEFDALHLGDYRETEDWILDED